jgi:hypothetical protein
MSHPPALFDFPSWDVGISSGELSSQNMHICKQQFSMDNVLPFIYDTALEPPRTRVPRLLSALLWFPHPRHRSPTQPKHYQEDLVGEDPRGSLSILLITR